MEYFEHIAPVSSLLGKPASQAAAVNQLHRHEDVASELPHVVDGEHVGMGQPRHRARLAQEPVAHLCLGGIARPARPQAPEGSDAPQAQAFWADSVVRPLVGLLSFRSD